MGLSHGQVGHKILAKIKIYTLTRAELLCSLCYEIPCIILDLSHSVIALVESSSKGRGRGFNYWLTTPLISSM